MLFVDIGLCFVFKLSPCLHDIIHYGGLCSLLLSLLWGGYQFMYMMYVVLWGCDWVLHPCIFFCFSLLEMHFLPLSFFFFICKKSPLLALHFHFRWVPKMVVYLGPILYLYFILHNNLLNIPMHKRTKRWGWISCLKS